MLKRKHEGMTKYDLTKEIAELCESTTKRLVEISDSCGVPRTPSFMNFIESMVEFFNEFDLEALSEEDF